MRVRSPLIATIACGLLATGLAGCGASSDDGGSAQSDPTTSGESTSDGSSSEIDTGLLDTRVADYKTYLIDESNTMLAATTKFTDAVRAGDVAKAKALFAPSRYHWETIEPLAGLVASVDGKVDSRVDDFASVNDPAFSGWHRLEYMLWVDGKLTPLSTKYANQLDRDLKPLPGLFEKADVTAKNVANGAAGLIEEVSEGKITGEEDRYSHTDLYDLAGNVNGSLRAFQAYEPVLLSVDRPLELKIEQAFLDAKALLGKYQHPDGSYGSYLDFKKTDRLRLQALLAGLSEDLSSVAGVLNL
ncbi:MAG TPA: EfeM/EfeO family lipoprotein [Nocardioidaceae bacterium]|nr:EfeM/EfeO family lipoprotein [Nocardioidaceae bacterium]